MVKPLLLTVGFPVIRLIGIHVKMAGTYNEVRIKPVIHSPVLIGAKIITKRGGASESNPA